MTEPETPETTESPEATETPEVPEPAKKPRKRRRNRSAGKTAPPESKVFSSADMPMVAAVGVRKVDPNMTATEKKLKDLGLIP